MNLSTKILKYLDGMRIFESLCDDEKAIFPLFALCFDLTGDTVLEQMAEFVKDLQEGILQELPDYDVDKVSNVRNYTGTGKLQYEMSRFGDRKIIDVLKDIFGEEKLNGTFSELYENHILAKTKRMAEKSREIVDMVNDAEPEVFENNFPQLLKRYDWTETEAEYHKEKKMHTVTMEWLQKKQERELQKVLEMDIMHHADEPSTQEIEDSDYQYHRRFLSHKFKDSPEYQEAYTKFMGFATRQDGMIVPNLGEYGKYIAININKFRPEQKKTLFAIIRKFELIREDAEQISQEKTEVKAPPTANTSCFRYDSDFVKASVCDIVISFYLGSAANLALIETAFYDHNLLLKRNSHRAFVKVLIGWGALPKLDKDTISKIANGMANKMMALPSSGYKEWESEIYSDEQKICTDIGLKLGPTMPYSRKKVQ